MALLTTVTDSFYWNWGHITSPEGISHFSLFTWIDAHESIIEGSFCSKNSFSVIKVVTLWQVGKTDLMIAGIYRMESLSEGCSEITGKQLISFSRIDFSSCLARGFYLIGGFTFSAFSDIAKVWVKFLSRFCLLLMAIIDLLASCSWLSRMTARFLRISIWDF